MTSTPTARIADIEEVHRAASEATGLSDFGDPDYLEALSVLVDSASVEAALTPTGIERFRGYLQSILQARLASEAGFARHPSYAEVPIDRPIFVTGLPRTGTTALSRLLVEDPSHQGLEYWLAEAPQPRPARETWDSQPGYQRLQASIDARYAERPGFEGVHFLSPAMVEECWRLEWQTFKSINFENLFHLPTYAAWLAEQGMADVYARHRRLLQLIGSHDQDRRWVLKHPGHIFALDGLMEAYPDALVVQTHRHPTSVIASVCSLNAQASRGSSDAHAGAALGASQLESWARGADRMMAARRNYDPARFVDVHYDDFVRDAVGTVEGIYDAFDITLSDAARSAIEMHHAETGISERKPTHRYSLADYGLTSDKVETRFRTYLDTYGC